MEKIINKLIEAVSQLKQKNKELADQVGHSTSIASKAVQLAVKVKQQEKELTNLSRQNKDLETKISTLKTIKHEYPKEVKVSNLPPDKKVQEVKINNFPPDKKIQKVEVVNKSEKPSWLAEVFADFFKVFTTVQSTIAAKTSEQGMSLLSKLWRGGIGVNFKEPQPFYIVDERGSKIKTKDILKLLSMGGGGTTVYRGAGNTSGKVKINAFKFGENPTKYDVDNSAVQIYDSTQDVQVTGLIITNSVDAGDLYIYNTNAVTTTNFLFKLGAGDDKQLALGYDASGKSSLYAIRAAAQTNDDVIVTKLYET